MHRFSELCIASVTLQKTSYSYNRFIQAGWQERTLSGAHLLALTIITTPLFLAALQLGTVSRRDRCVQAVLLCFNILCIQSLNSNMVVYIHYCQFYFPPVFSLFPSLFQLFILLLFTEDICVYFSSLASTRT